MPTQAAMRAAKDILCIEHEPTSLEHELACIIDQQFPGYDELKEAAEELIQAACKCHRCATLRAALAKAAK